MTNRVDSMRALMDLVEAEEAAAMGTSTMDSDSSDHASTDSTQSGDLHANVEDAWQALKEFMDGRPDLADPSVREQYLPIKQAYDEAISALGQDSRSKV